MTPDQQQFIEDAEASGLKVRFDYSGRWMFGSTCPAVVIERPEQLRTVVRVVWDDMGHDYVAYVPDPVECVQMAWENPESRHLDRATILRYVGRGGRCVLRLR